MMTTAHVALFDQLADWETGHLQTELRTGRFTGHPVAVRTVGVTLDPIVTMGGFRVQPDLALSDLDPAHSDLLILPGGVSWFGADNDPFAAAAAGFLAAGVPVAAICGANLGLARAGLLDERDHTSDDAGVLASTGYAGGHRFRDARAVVDGGLITAGPSSPVQFARATLEHVGLFSTTVGAAYEALFFHEDPAGFPVLMQAGS